MLSGEKTSITFSDQCDAMILFARTGAADAGARGISAFLVPMDLPGIQRTRFNDVGSKIIGRGSVFFDEVRVPAENMMGAEGKGFTQVMQGFDFSRILIALQCLGAAQASIDETWEYVKERQAMGAPLVQYQGVSFPIVEFETLIAACRQLSYHALALRDAVAAGEVLGPRIVDAGRSLSTTSGHMDATLSLSEDLHPAIDQDNLCDGIESCRQAVRFQIRRGVDVIKIATTGGVNSRIGAGLGRQAFDDEIKALVDTAHLYGKKMAVHAHGTDGVNAALSAGADSIEHGTLLDDQSIRLFKAGGAYYVPTLSTVNGYLERLAANPAAYPPDVLEKVKWRISVTGKSLEKAYPAGVKIAFGTDAGVSKHGRNADEFELMVKHGMSPAAAIEAATVNAARLLGVDRETGTLEPGKAADIIAVDGDPLRDVTLLKQVRFVMKGGVVAKQ